MSQSLMLTFTRFKLEQHPNCSSDYLSIYDGSWSRRIGRYCGETLPNNGQGINTTHYVAGLWFHADNSVNRDGFTLRWTSITPSQYSIGISQNLARFEYT